MIEIVIARTSRNVESINVARETETCNKGLVEVSERTL